MREYCQIFSATMTLVECHCCTEDPIPLKNTIECHCCTERFICILSTSLNCKGRRQKRELVRKGGTGGKRPKLLKNLPFKKTQFSPLETNGRADENLKRLPFPKTSSRPVEVDKLSKTFRNEGRYEGSSVFSSWVSHPLIAQLTCYHIVRAFLCNAL